MISVLDISPLQYWHEAFNDLKKVLKMTVFVNRDKLIPPLPVLDLNVVREAA